MRVNHALALVRETSGGIISVITFFRRYDALALASILAMALASALNLDFFGIRHTGKLSVLPRRHLDVLVLQQLRRVAHHLLNPHTYPAARSRTCVHAQSRAVA
jgi:hypothetical protein